MNKTEYKVTVWENGRQEWRNDKGEWHRLDGPAYFRGDKYQAWYVNGKRHRLDGPAFIVGDYQSWYIEGVNYTKEEFDEYIAMMERPQTIPEVKTIELDGKLYEIKLLEGQ